MVSTRNTRGDVVEAAGRLFAERGYHGTSMRDLGRELGLLGSSLYSHVDSKQDLLVEVVESGAALFRASADRAIEIGDGDPEETLRALIAGHVEVVIENLDIARTFLNEARMLDTAHRRRVLAARDAYEADFRAVISKGVDQGLFAPDLDVKASAIFLLSILNAIERWFRVDGELDREQLVAELSDFALAGLEGRAHH
jgi:AcrR family transcriptional regulator